MSENKLQVLVGKIIKSIDGLEKGSDEVEINTVCGGKYQFYHVQDCCEYVRLEDFDGDENDLIGGLIVSAEEVSSDEAPSPENADSYTWTFYKIETTKGGLWLRWLGESNGYYSERVDFVEIQ